MAAHKKTIADLEALSAKNNNAIKNHLEQLGKQISLLDDEMLVEAPFLGLVSEVRLKESELSQKEKTISEWNNLSDKYDALTNDVRLLDAEIAAKRADIEPHFESIGEAVLDVYESSDSEMGELSNRAEQIVALQDVIREKERELQSIESGDGQDSFIGKTLAVGKGIVIRGALKSRGMRRARALRDIGEKICEMGADEIVGNTRLAQVIFPVHDAIDELARLRTKRDKIEKSQAKLQDRRTEIEKQERMRNPIRNLGHAADLLRTQIGELSAQIGSSYVESGSSVGESDSVVSASLAAIGQLNEQNEQAKTLTARLTAAMQVDRLSEQIDSKKAAITRLESEIETVNAAIEELKVQKTAQTKIRGALGSLEASAKDILSDAE